MRKTSSFSFLLFPLLLTSLLLCNSVGRCETHWVVRFDVESGLPINIVKSIFQDSDGYVWMATDGGFCRYDGIHFETINSDLNNPFIKRFYENHNGEPFVISDGGVAISSDRRSFQKMTFDGELFFPKDMFQDNDSDRWFAEPNAVVRCRDGVLHRYPFPEAHHADSYDTSFLFFRDPWSRLVVLSNRGGIFVYNTQADRFDEKEHNLQKEGLRFYSYLRLADGQAFVGSNRGVFRLVAPSRDVPWILEKAISIPSVSCLEQGDDGRLYVGTFDSGLYTVEPPFENVEARSVSELPFRSIYDLHRAREGSIWAASNEGAAVLASHWFGSIREELNNALISVMARGPDDVCYASDGNVVYEIRREGNEATVDRLDLPENVPITSLYYGNGTLYVGCREGYVVTIRDGESKRIDLPNIANKIVFFMNGDRRNRVWICVDGLDGVFQLAEDGSVDHYADDRGLTTHVNVVREGPQGEIYAGGNGPDDYLFRYDEARDRFVRLAGDARSHGGLAVNDTCVTSDGSVWLATNRGLWLYDGDDCAPVRGEVDILNDSILTVLCHRDNVWLGTVKGLYRYAQGQLFRYTTKEGLPSYTLNYRARVLTQKGNLYFGTSNGVAYWRRSDFAIRKTPQPVFQSLKIDEEDLLGDDTHSIDFPYHTFLEVEYASLIFPSDDIRYQYRLVRSSAGWIDRSGHNLIVPNLNAGRRLLQIRAQKNGYAWSVPLEYAFTIRNPFYTSPWAYVLYVLALLSMAAAVRWIRRMVLERRHSQAALLESEDRFRNLVRSAGGVFMYLSPDLRILEFNAEAEYLFQKRREDVLRIPLHDIFLHHREYEIVQNEIRNLMQSKVATHFESVLESPELGLRYLYWTIRKIGEDGHAKGLILLGQDVTELHNIQDELRGAKESAERANRAKSDFLARMSHELRTPLNSVIGFSRILIKRGASLLEDRDVTYLSRINQNGEHLLHLINEILDLSKVEAGRMEMRPGYVYLDQLIIETIEQLEAQAYQKGLKLDCALPPKSTPLYTDETLLKQILINLIGNGIKFTKEGRVTVRLIVEPKTHEPLKIVVEDTGIGIPADMLGSIFNAFQQVDESTTRRFEGTGLGLTITRSFCELLGYQIKVDSTPWQGSVFTVLFDGG